MRLPLSLSIALFFSCPILADALSLPPCSRTQLSNGITLVLMEQHEVPIISLSVVVKAGSAADPAGKAGLASLTAELLRKGTRTRTALQIAKEVDFIGGELDFNVNTDFTEGSAEFLRKDIERGLDLLADILLNPAFSPEEVTKLVKQRVDAIKVSKDQPRSVIATYYSAYLYKDHPYGFPRNGDENSLAKITREDVLDFYRSYYAPGNVVIAAAGDFSAAELTESLKKRLEGWSAGPAKPGTIPQVKMAEGRRLLMVTKSDATQTFFRIGNIGIERTNPDRVFVDVVNTLFGGRFTSMLNSELRIKSGLTYGAGSSFQERKVPGPFAISSYTGNDSTEKAIDLALDVLHRLHQQGINQEQLDSAKSYLKGQFPLTIETTDELASLLAELEYFGLDQKEISEYYAKIDAMTLGDARRVIDKYFPAGNLVFVLIGKEDVIARLASKYATQVDRKDIAEPGF